MMSNEYRTPRRLAVEVAQHAARFEREETERMVELRRHFEAEDRLPETRRLHDDLPNTFAP